MIDFWYDISKIRFNLESRNEIAKEQLGLMIIFRIFSDIVIDSQQRKISIIDGKRVWNGTSCTLYPNNQEKKMKKDEKQLQKVNIYVLVDCHMT